MRYGCSEAGNFMKTEANFDSMCYVFGQHNWLKDYRNQIIPDDIPQEHLEWWSEFYHVGGDKYNLSQYAVRNCAIKLCGFTLVTNKFADALADFIRSKTDKHHPVPAVLELGCGLGVVSLALANRGIKMLAIDNYERTRTFNFADNMWVKGVIKMDMLEAVEDFAKEVDFILCSWPEMDGKIDEVPKLMHDLNPNCKFIYCGEWMGGCTANDRFFASVKEVDPMDSVNDVYCQWNGIHDNWTLLDYNQEDQEKFDKGEYDYEY